MDWMIEHDVDVINMSLGFTWEGPGDGTTPYTNGIQRSVATPVAGGITWVNSAGNESQSTWFGRFTDTDGNRLHEFTANDNCNNYALYVEGELFAARFLREENLKIQLRWDDRWGGANRDLNLILARYDEGTGRFEIYDSSDSAQSGGAAHIPFEYINVTVPAGAYCLAIDRKNGTMPNWIQLQDFTGELLLHHTLHHSIGNPAESRNLGLLAVGAAPAFETNTIEPYSSQGPTPDGRMKPDIVGVARGQSVSYSSAERPDGRWAGTSQSSPHVAGLAALVKQRFPDYTPEQIANYLKTHADPRGAVPNNTWGYGFARLPATDEATSTPGPTATAEPTPEPTPSPEPTPEPTPEPMPTPPADPCAENLGADSTIQGSWSDDCPSESRSGSYAIYYTFSLTESAEVTITLVSSVDPYLYLREGIGRDGTVLCENDDYALGVTSTLCSNIDSSPDTSTDSGMVASLAEGTYTIEATTYEVAATGDFTLTVEVATSSVQSQPSPTPVPSPSPTPVPLPPDYSIEDHACNVDDLADIEGFSLVTTDGPHTYDGSGYNGVVQTYITEWMNVDSSAGIVCAAVQYNSLENARWSGLNYTVIQQRNGASVDLRDHEQDFIPSIGDDMLAYRLHYHTNNDFHTLATVRFLDASTITLTRVTFHAFGTDEYPSIAKSEGIAQKIATRVIPTDDATSQSENAQSSNGILESFNWNR